MNIFNHKSGAVSKDCGRTLYKVYFMVNGRKVYMMSGGKTEFIERQARRIAKLVESPFRKCFLEPVDG